jgi:hypothetical protein
MFGGQFSNRQFIDFHGVEISVPSRAQDTNHRPSQASEQATETFDGAFCAEDAADHVRIDQCGPRCLRRWERPGIEHPSGMLGGALRRAQTDLANRMPVQFPQENDSAFRGGRGPGPVHLARSHLAHGRVPYRKLYKITTTKCKM